MSLSGVSLLSQLQEAKPLSADESVVTILTCLASYTDLNDAWTYPKTRDYACALSGIYAASESLSTILTGLLQERVKPLFAKTKNPAITQQGRKAIDPLPISTTAHSDLDDESKPWKYRDVHIVTVFQWVLSRLDVRIIMKPFVSILWLTFKARNCQWRQIGH